MSLLFVLQYDYALWFLKILAFDHDFNWYNLSCEFKQKKIIPQKKSDIIMKRRDSGITRRQRLITAQHSHIRVHSWLKYAPVGVQVAAIACRAGGIGGQGGTFFPPPDFGRSINPVLTRRNGFTLKVS